MCLTTCETEFLREKQVHGNLFGTTHSHKTDEKERKNNSVLPFFIPRENQYNRYPIHFVLLTNQVLLLSKGLNNFKVYGLFHSAFIDDIFNTVLKVDIHT